MASKNDQQKSEAYFDQPINIEQHIDMGKAIKKNI
jgi:hypothetical protein